MLSCRFALQARTCAADHRTTLLHDAGACTLWQDGPCRSPSFRRSVIPVAPGTSLATAIVARLPEAEAKSLAAVEFFRRYEAERHARQEDFNRPSALGLQLGSLRREISLARARATTLPQPAAVADMSAAPPASALVATTG